MVFTTRTRSAHFGFWVNNLDLARGENIVRIVVANSSTNITCATNGVSSFYRSAYVYITLIVGQNGNVVEMCK